MMLRAALGFASRGWAVIPLAIGGKAPMGKLVPRGIAHATCDTEVISYWWSRAPRANVAIACRDLFVVDIDPRNGGDRNIAQLLEQYGPLPTTPTQRTGRGGTHHLFRRPAIPLRGKLVGGVDLVHGARRYIVAAPSALGGASTYEWIIPPSASLADPPEWLVRLAQPPDALPAAGTLPASPRSDRVARAVAYARKIPPAVAGQNGHAHTFLTACRLVRGFLLAPEEAYAVMSAWNRSCQPPWSERDLRRKIDQALKYSRLAFGALLGEETR